MPGGGGVFATLSLVTVNVVYYLPSIVLLFEFFFKSLTPVTYEYCTEAVNPLEHFSLLAQ